MMYADMDEMEGEMMYGEEMMGSDEEGDHDMMGEGDSYGMEGGPYDDEEHEVNYLLMNTSFTIGATLSQF